MFLWETFATSLSLYWVSSKSQKCLWYINTIQSWWTHAVTFSIQCSILRKTSSYKHTHPPGVYMGTKPNLTGAQKKKKEKKKATLVVITGWVTALLSSTLARLFVLHTSCLHCGCSLRGDRLTVDTDTLSLWAESKHNQGMLKVKHYV